MLQIAAFNIKPMLHLESSSKRALFTSVCHGQMQKSSILRQACWFHIILSIVIENKSFILSFHISARLNIYI